MDATFSIIVDPARDYVRITMSGFFGLQDIDVFNRAQHTEYRALSCAAGEHVSLVDIRGMKIQAQESVDGFRACVNDPALRSRRIAFVVGASLARMQLQRAAVERRETSAYFCSIEEAEAWLFADAASTAQAA